MDITEHINKQLTVTQTPIDPNTIDLESTVNNFFDAPNSVLLIQSPESCNSEMSVPCSPVIMSNRKRKQLLEKEHSDSYSSPEDNEVIPPSPATTTTTINREDNDFRLNEIVDDYENDSDEIEIENERKKRRGLHGATADKKRLVWTPELHALFVDAVHRLGVRAAVPKAILQLMNKPGLTRENIASHLQKYRIHLQRQSNKSTDTPKKVEMSPLSTESCIEHSNEAYTIPRSPSMFSKSPNVVNVYPGFQYVIPPGHSVPQYNVSPNGVITNAPTTINNYYSPNLNPLQQQQQQQHRFNKMDSLFSAASFLDSDNNQIQIVNNSIPRSTSNSKNNFSMSQHFTPALHTHGPLFTLANNVAPSAHTFALPLTASEVLNANVLAEIEKDTFPIE